MVLCQGSLQKIARKFDLWRSLEPSTFSWHLRKKYVCSWQNGKSPNCIYRGEPSPPPPLGTHKTHGPFGTSKCVCAMAVGWGVTSYVGTTPWWPAAVAPGRVGRPPATFPATFPADPKMCWISYGMVGGTYLGVLGHPVSAIFIRPASVKGTCATYPHWMETA